MAFAPLCGIQIFDYYFLRGRKIDIRAMFVGAPDGIDIACVRPRTESTIDLHDGQNPVSPATVMYPTTAAGMTLTFAMSFHVGPMGD